MFLLASLYETGLFLLATLVVSGSAYAQHSANDHSNAHDEGSLYGNLCAGGVSDTQVGASLGIYNTSMLKGFFPIGASAELGTILPGDAHNPEGFFSANHLSIFSAPGNDVLFPFVTVGYTRLFVSGNAVNDGGGVIYRYHVKEDLTSELRLRYRDYFQPGAEHRYAIRLSVENSSREFRQ